ncbi:MAG: trypsin-like serine protease [Rhodocyclaceae bacterium]|nr:MAG: trypsin-like serine protease [Rhodocyclaceae bacterium]CAG0932503.1 Periplasmic serine endoprotease DegP [Rhodocyclaceae bacterium]
MKKFPGLLAIATVALAPAAALAQDDSERIFRKAQAYTVRVKTSVPVPFAGDKRGTLIGAGFVVDAGRGWIMTNAHVVSRSPARVQVAFHGQEFGPARKVYVDPFLDLAVIEARPEDGRMLAAAELECRDQPAMGHPVGAYGHPWRFYYTGTRGIVSGVTSKYRTEYLQTDAPVDSGNSGGPLISLTSGKIVGINTAAMKEPKSKNTNFAVSMKYACRVLELLQAGRDPSPPQLPLVFFRNLDGERTVKVARSLLPGQELPLRAGHIIKTVEGMPGRVSNPTQLIHALRGRLETVTLTVEENGAERSISGRLSPADSTLNRNGVFVSGILFALRDTFREVADIAFPEIEVHYVEDGSTGQAIEIEAMDFLEQVDGRAVKSLQELSDLLATAVREQRPALLTLRRLDIAEEIGMSSIERTLQVEGLRWIGESQNRP